jgi:Spy/CpxP family protein refolding chaperone
MKKRLLTFGLILLVVINVSALLTFAYNRWFRAPGSLPAEGSGLADAFERHLCLSGEQEKCIRDIRFSFDSEIGDVQAQMREKRRAMVEEMKKESPDSTLIDKLIEEISRLQAELQKKAVLNLLKEKEVLTPEQKAAFFRMFEDHVCPREKGASHGSAGAGDARCPQEIGR